MVRAYPIPVPDRVFPWRKSTVFRERPEVSDCDRRTVTETVKTDDCDLCAAALQFSQLMQCRSPMVIKYQRLS